MQISGSVTAPTLLHSIDTTAEGLLVIDYSGASFVQPAGLVGAAALAERARHAGRPVQFITAADSGVANYLSRMGLGAVLTDLGVAHEIGAVRSNPMAGDLLEVSKVSGQNAGERVAEMIYDKLTRSDADPQVCDAMHAAICEVVGNVEFHAAVDGGYIAAQTTHSGKRVAFALADSGQGLKASLERSIPVNDDENALQMATTANISGTGERGRGQGLPEVINSATQLRGTVHLASGNAYAQFKHATISKLSLSNSFPGTFIQVELDCTPGN